MRYTTYILQEKQESIDEIAESICASFDVVGSSTSGNKALEEVERLAPDVLITGLISSGIDGLAVIDGLKKKELGVKIMVVSAITRDEVVKKALDLGAAYYMVKPVDGKVLLERLFELASGSSDMKRRDGFSLDEKISKIFISVGIPPHIKGYAYLREGVKMAVKSPDIINNITKKLYPGIGEKYSTSASKVERAIRHAIEVAWNRGRIESINSVFGVRAYVGSDKPTNGEFIALVADKMILEGA